MMSSMRDVRETVVTVSSLRIKKLILVEVEVALVFVVGNSGWSVRVGVVLMIISISISISTSSSSKNKSTMRSYLHQCFSSRTMTQAAPQRQSSNKSSLARSVVLARSWVYSDSHRSRPSTNMQTDPDEVSSVKRQASSVKKSRHAVIAVTIECIMLLCTFRCGRTSLN